MQANMQACVCERERETGIGWESLREAGIPVIGLYDVGYGC